MAGLDLEVLERWCQDAITLLPTPELPQSIVELRRSAVAAQSGRRGLHSIAEDLAEGLSQLPTEERKRAQDFLKKKYGFGYELYAEAKFKHIRSIINSGKISNEFEYREMLEVSADTRLEGGLRECLRDLIAQYEAARVRK